MGTIRHTIKLQSSTFGGAWRTLVQFDKERMSPEAIEEAIRKRQILGKLFVPPPRYRIIESVSEIEYLD